jgi:two-component system cell cycle response regulator
VLAEVAGYLKPKFAEAVDSGFNKVVIDIHQLRSLHMGVIKVLFQGMETCRDLGMKFGLVGNAHIISECKGFEDTRNWTFYESLDEAKASVGRTSSSMPQLAGVS